MIQEEKLPTAEEFFKRWCNETKRSGGVLIGSSVREFLAAYESHTAAHTASLRERVKELEFGAQVDSDCIESQSNEIDELKAWKESAMKELNALDLQSLGRKLGIGLGQSVSENVHAKVDGLLERVKELEGTLSAYKECFEQFVPESKWDEATAFLSSYGNGLAKDFQLKENQ